jgi:hypothetical protein
VTVNIYELFFFLITLGFSSACAHISGRFEPEIKAWTRCLTLKPWLSLSPIMCVDPFPPPPPPTHPPPHPLFRPRAGQGPGPGSDLNSSWDVGSEYELQRYRYWRICNIQLTINQLHMFLHVTYNQLHGYSTQCDQCCLWHASVSNIPKKAWQRFWTTFHSTRSTFAKCNVEFSHRRLPIIVYWP